MARVSNAISFVCPHKIHERLQCHDTKLWNQTPDTSDITLPCFSLLFSFHCCVFLCDSSSIYPPLSLYIITMLFFSPGFAASQLMPHSFVSFSRKARERMIELSQTRDGAKEEGTEGWREACFMGNGFREAKEESSRREAAEGGVKQLHCPPPSSSNSLMDNISGEFALVINGHSLV